MTATSLRATALTLFLLASACDRPSPTGAAKTTKPTKWYPVDTRLVTVPATEAERARMEKAAFDRLLQVVRPEQAARLGMQLTSKDPEERKSIVEIDNAEAAQLIAQIYAVDEARYKDRYVAEMRKLATLQSTYVTVGVLPALPTGDYVAAVFRSPGGTSENTLVIVGDQFNEIRVGQALKLLNRSRLRHGEYPVTPVRLYVRGAPPDARALTDDERATARRVISEMRDAQLGQVPGFGRIRSKKLVVGPAKG